MIVSVLRFSDLLLGSLLVGTMFGIWLGFNPVSLSAGAYVEHQQQAIRALNTPMPILGLTCIVLTVALAAFERGNSPAWYFLVIAVADFAVAGIITRFANQPLNAQMMMWTPLAPPPNWMELRDAWWNWHIARTAAGVFGQSFLILATLWPK